MAGFISDVRCAARGLKRSPWFSVVAVATLSLGIGGTTALFSLVDAVVLRQLPFRQPGRLVEIWGRDARRTGMRVPGSILDALRSRSKALQAIGTHDPTTGVLSTPGGAIEIRGETVSANFVEVFGVVPLIGRGFVPEDERAGAAATMLVSDAFWRQYLGADPNAAGRVVYLSGAPFTVLGVMPRTFRTAFFSVAPDFWTVYAGSPSRARERELGYEVVARLAQDATIESAGGEIERIASSVGVEDWRRTGRRIGLVPLKEEVVGNRAYALELLLAAVSLVLGIACANLAQLLLARSDDRTAEFATRKAIGASSAQLFRLAFSESVLLSVAGGAIGILLAYWLVPLLRSLAPSEIPRLADAAVDVRVMTAALVITIVTGCAFGAVPALRASTQGSRYSSRFRFALVVAQVAASVALLALAGLVVQTFVTLLPSSPGFATESRAAFVWSVPERRFPDAADRRQRLDEVRRRLAAAPGVESVAIASGIPFGDDEPRRVPIRRRDETGPAQDAPLRADVRAVSPGFLELFQMPLVEGRAFAATDQTEAGRVALVNRTLAARLAPSGHVIGQMVRIGTAPTAPLHEIVGVIADTRWWGTTLEPLNEVYVPLAQDRASFGFLIVQSRLDAASLTKTIKAAFNDALPGLALPASRRALPLADMVARSIAGQRLNATLVAAFSGMALLLAVIGLFGLVAHSVSQRRHEIGIRAALGARPVDLVVMTVRTALMLTTAGVAVGVASGAYLTRFVESQLYGIDRYDRSTFAAAAALMIVSSGLAAYWPARRVAYADPMEALRHETTRIAP